MGATGYTGGLVLDALLRRGLKPVVAGRNRDALASIAERCGGLDYAIADVADPAAVANLVQRGDVLISTVGPFERFGYAVARAAAESGAHYIDSTGEVGFVLELRRQLHDRRNATLVSGTEVLFLPLDFPTLDFVTVYNGWFPALSRPIAAMSGLTAGMTRIPLGRKLIDIATRPMIGPPGGPDAAERSRTRTHVVAVATANGVPPVEVHVEGPSAYTLTGELMAWAAHQLTTTPPETAGVLGPVEAFGFDTLRAGCAEVGLLPV
ncbi:saccharopine dehydrogenase NADP-binding domain-containing protein [Nocardia rhizosphaerihabitans]|uniref:saccharopine dehydrogenase NADP-binding domain-containing protein n=1 Tax=Nocardia rhizosphaerihabitans TaxID=1691570 RepID=UPI00366C7D4B